MSGDKDTEFLKDSENYLEKHKIYNIFQELLEGIIVQKPKDPINYMLNTITNEESNLLNFLFKNN